MSATIASAFARYFAHWDITLPDDAMSTHSRGEIRKAGWFIRYLWGGEGDDLYLDFYAAHRMTNDRHARIHVDGTLEDLPAYQDMLVYNPAIPGDEDRARREYTAYSQRVTKELRAKGWS